MDAGCSRRTARSNTWSAATATDRSCTSWTSTPPSGVVRVTDFMPPRGTDPDVVRIVEALEGSVPMRMELVIRFDYGSIVPWVRRLEDDSRVAIAGPDALSLRTPVEVRGENLTTVAEFTAAPGERYPFVLTWFPSHREAPRSCRCGPRPRGHLCVLGRVAHVLRVPGPLRGAGLPLVDGAEGADVLPDRRARRSPHDLAAGADRRRAELGLSLLLVARRELRARRARRKRVRRRGGRLAELAPPGGRRRSRRSPDHVRAGRRAPPDRARAALARRLRGLAAGSDRQRREPAVPARRLRRGARRALSGAQSRAPARTTTRGRSSVTCLGISSSGGASRTRESGRCAAHAGSSRIRR